MKMASKNDPKVDELEAGPEVAAAASSYELKCPICLEDYDNKAFVNVCFHAFCYVCIVQWSEVSNKCPMCKVSFKSLIYDVKTESNYKTHIISSSSRRQDSREVSINEARRFRYRTTVLPGERQPLESQRHRLQQSRKPATEERRRTVYQAGMRALPFTTEGKKVRIRNISASFFKSNPAAVHRLLPWLSRDIKATLGEEHVEFMIQLILSIIDKINIDSDEFIEHLRPFFHHRTEHFVHEFISFAKSPLDMMAYDHKVSYGLPSSVHGAKRTGTSSDGGDVNERGESSQAGPSSTAPEGETAPASVEEGRDKGEGEGEGAQSEDEMHKRILYELATSTWDESPIITRKPDTPPSNRAQDSDQDFIIISTSPSVSDIEGLVPRDEGVQDNRVTCSTGRDRGEKQDEGESEGSRVCEKRRKSSKSSKTKSRKHKKSYLSDSGSCSEEREERRRRKRRSRSRERTNSPSLTPEYYYKDSKRTYDKKRKHRSSTHHKQRKSDRSSRDESCDHRSHSRYHGYSSRDRSQSSHGQERKRYHKRHAKRGKRSHEKEKRSQKRLRDRSHDKKKADMLSGDYSTSDDDCDVLSDGEIKRELEDINNDLLNMKKRLLKHCLHRERATLLKSALQKELGGIDTPLDTPTNEDEGGSSSIDELEDELMRIERDIEMSRNEVAAVNERLEKD
ncbi:PREDICTED: E3 ubiquitin-protein ligase Topors-like [Amphimedon queenslandica]|uniref:RING-type E3 ubiquitin transferase n=2 Tax=Amphimedon queenslandica TaxID=400682 RepID=A0A1X7U9A6_AMPQE|nr:PREDICTED: E3 ubiquitin-protein ligase Topors-like [Amphimedon queenslandica]|eukprot:XP_003388691.2 PREDICTED: E3 ubiquitin-protein ligase Topors-like [Amphimedon queenslandica]